MGNAVTLARWNDIWFNEGWATWSEWIWNNANAGGPTPAELFDDLYANTPAEDWEIAPAILDGDPANLFVGFPVYDRGAMVIQGTREVLGEGRFRFLIRTLMNDFRYGNIGTEGFIGLVKRVSGFSGERRARLDAFLRQWLYGETKPTLLPEDV
jgi:aminopeptidase N